MPIQTRPQGFPFPFFNGKALGTRLAPILKVQTFQGAQGAWSNKYDMRTFMILRRNYVTRTINLKTREILQEIIVPPTCSVFLDLKGSTFLVDVTDTL